MNPSIEDYKKYIEKINNQSSITLMHKNLNKSTDAPLKLKENLETNRTIIQKHD